MYMTGRVVSIGAFSVSQKREGMLVTLRSIPRLSRTMNLGRFIPCRCCATGVTPGIQQNSAQPGIRTLPLGVLANPDEHVYIATDDTTATIERLWETDRFVFIRSGVAAGKSTLAKAMARYNPSLYVLLKSPTVDEQGWKRSFVAEVTPTCHDSGTEPSYCGFCPRDITAWIENTARYNLDGSRLPVLAYEALAYSRTGCPALKTVSALKRS